MSAAIIEIGSYGLPPELVPNRFEDECVGSGPLASRGIVVSRIEEDRVMICDWQFSFHFEGGDSLERFEEAKHSQAFEVTFSNERELDNSDLLDGTDPILKAQLRKQIERRSRH